MLTERHILIQEALLTAVPWSMEHKHQEEAFLIQSMGQIHIAETASNAGKLHKNFYLGNGAHAPFFLLSCVIKIFLISFDD